VSMLKVVISVVSASALCSGDGGLDALMVGPPAIPTLSGRAVPPLIDALAPVRSRTLAPAAAPQPQVIAFTSRPAWVTVYGQSFTVHAQASSGLPVSYKSITPAVCSVDGMNGAALTAGDCTIVANQVGNASVMAARAQTTFTVLKASQSITFSPPSEVPSGASSTSLEASSSSGLPVRFSSLTPEVCAIVGSSVAPVASAGVCAIRAVQSGNANFAAAQEQGTTIVCPQVVLNHYAPTRWTVNFWPTSGYAKYAAIHLSTQQVVTAFFGSDEYDDPGGHIEVTTSGTVRGCTGTVEMVLTLKRDTVNRLTVLRLTGLVDLQSESQQISGSYTSNEISPSTGLEEVGNFVMRRE